MNTTRGTALAAAWPSQAIQPAWILAALLGIALAVRIVFFTGFMGSDEVVYTSGAVRLLQGEVNTSFYIGSLRYGVDMPVAFFIWLFGPTVAAASSWAMLASLLEVAFVFYCALALWGLRAAVLSALVLAFLPLHIHLAGRLLADTPLAAAISASFLCFYMGNRRNASGWFFACGLAVGAVFWIKQAAIVYIVAFPLIALVTRSWNWKWLWAAAGALLMLAANCAVMWYLQGNPWQVFVVTARATESYDTWTVVDSPWTYFRYLFVDIRHTWLLAYLAVLGAAIGAVRAMRSNRSSGSILYPALWAGILIAVFSFAVITWNPVRFVMKQSNYMLMFAAPLCLLAGYGLAHLRSTVAAALIAIYAAGGLLLAALMQQDIHVFRANSYEALAYAKAHPEAAVYATTNAYRLALFEAMLSEDQSAKPVLKDLAKLDEPKAGAADTASPRQQRVAIVDTQTAHWGLQDMRKLPSCLQPLGELPRGKTDSAGSHMVNALVHLSHIVPSSLEARLAPRLEGLREPKPARIYAVPPGCSLAAS